MNVLITGVAGFVGSSFVKFLQQQKSGTYEVIGIDNFDNYYPRRMKEVNIKRISSQSFKFYEADILDADFISKIVRDHEIEIIVHFAAKAGVRNSIKDPKGYYNTNVLGLINLLEVSVKHGIEKFVFASSSSVYGNNPLPFSEDQDVSNPESPYAATKIAGEHLCKLYRKLYGINFSILRFFTVYGPYQRPEMAIAKFTHMIYNKKTIPVFGNGENMRDYTYIDDILKGVFMSMQNVSGLEIYNLGNSNPIKLKDLINLIAENLKIKPKIEHLPLSKGDVMHTYASIEKSSKLLNFSPEISIEDGIKKFVSWYLEEGKQFYDLNF